jgi:hypothetical protein
MAQTCSKCSRVNPADASYCYYDGSLLEGHSQNGGGVRGTQTFSSHFVFPSGLICRNFDQLAQACQENWTQAVELLQEGYLERFLGGLGRADLAFAAREASRFPDRDRGLDQLLAKLPSQVLQPPKVHIEPRDVNLGIMQVGDNRNFELHLANNGARLLYGSVTSEDCKWLTLGDAPGTSQKVFQFGTEMVIPVQVRGANLRAGNKPLEGRLLIESNGGNTSITVRCEVPVKPFTEGVLAGARSPRQIAEKAKAAPKDAASLFEKGVVADWYKANGWTYPVQGPSAAGLGAVQQFFEALGLTAPPKVDINEKFIAFHGNVGGQLRHSLEVKSQEKRPVFAHGTSDQPWIVVERAQLNGRTAIIPVSIPRVPDRPGEVLQGKVTVTSNGNQRFVVPVTLNIGGTRRSGYAEPIIMMEETVPVEPVFAEVQPMPVVIPQPVTAEPVMVAPVQPVRQPARPEIMPVAAVATPVMVMPEQPVMAQAPALVVPRATRRGTSFWIHAIPVFVLLLTLLGMVIHDFFTKKVEEEFIAVHPEPQVKVSFLDHVMMLPGRINPDVKEPDTKLGPMSLRFGITMPLKDSPKQNEKGENIEDKDANPSGKKRLTYFDEGTSNNVCLRIDGNEYLLGSPTVGSWTQTNLPLGDPKKKDGNFKMDGPNHSKRERLGRKSIYLFEGSKIQVTQIVEVIPNEQPADIEVKGKTEERHLLDTVLVRYEIENKDTKPHKVGIRFLLDTFIGTNDGVPFTIPGESELCKTKLEFGGVSGRKIPDYIQALEFPDRELQVKFNGTVAHLALKVPGLKEPPNRVTLGAWPHVSLNKLDQKAKGHMTMWDVPFLDMKSGGRSDSAVTMYWNEVELQPGQKREVGFTYGLGELSGVGGKIGLSTGGDFSVGREFTVTALINAPKPGDKATIKLPEGLKLVDEKSQTQDVPPVPAGAASNDSPVTWKVKAMKAGRSKITVTTSSGATQSKKVKIKEKSTIFG